MSKPNNAWRMPHGTPYNEAKPGLTSRAGSAVWRWVKNNAYRHRIKLRPVWFALPVWLLGAAARFTTWIGKPQFVWITLGVLAAIAALVGLAAVKGKRDRVYFATASAISLAWIAAASYWLISWLDVLTYVWVVATGIGVTGWLFDHRIRGLIRVQRWHDEFPTTLEIAGYGTVTQTTTEEETDPVTKRTKYVRHYLTFPRGLDRDALTAKMIEVSLPDARPGSVTILPDKKNRRRTCVQYVPDSPWETAKGLDKPVKHPVFAALAEINKRLVAADLNRLNGNTEIPEAFRAQLPPELRRWVPAGASVAEGIPLGNRDDGAPNVYIVWDHEHGAHHLLVGGQKGAGKTNLTNVFIAGLAPCYDAIIWAIDVRKAGQSFVHWGEVIDWVATTPEEATFMLRAGRAMITDRGQRAVRKRRMTDKHLPSRDEPLLVIVIDEAAALCNGEHGWNSAATKAGEEIGTGGRGEGVTEMVFTQRPTVEALGNSGTWRAQMDDRIGMRNGNAGEGRFTLNAWDKLDTSTLAQDGMFYMEIGTTSTDARLNRGFKFCEPEKVAKVSPIYAPHRPQLNADDTATVMRVAGQFYAHRRRWLDPDYEPVQAASPEPMFVPLDSTNQTGAPTVNTDPTAGPRLFDTLSANPPVSLLDTDDVVRAAANRHAAALNEGLEEYAKNPPVAAPEVGDLDELVTHNKTPGEPVDVSERVTRRLLEILLNRRETGVQPRELAVEANTSDSTVGRRLTALRDAGMAYSTGKTKNVTWHVNQENDRVKQFAVSA